MHDIIIVGGGIVGLATAMKLQEAQADLKILVLDKEDQVARHQTGNNSGVIHSGIYYKPGSLRATNCRRGYDMLLEFAKKENVPHEVCGKIIVATREEELEALEALFERGKENGLEGLKMLNEKEIKEHEPHVNGIKAIHVPQAGIIDYKIVSQKYAERFKAGGGEILFQQKVTKLEQANGECSVVTEKNSYKAKLVINCAGLYADKIAGKAAKELGVQIIPFRGEYYVVKKEKEYLVNHLVYPVPDSNFPFLGVHFTRFIAGGIEAGPNAVLAYAREGYKKSTIKIGELIDSLTFIGFIRLAAKYWRTGLGEFHRSYSKKAFTKALQRLVPEIQEDDLKAGGAGVRASATSVDGKVVDDFIFHESEHVIHVLNSPSPAATASLSIGQTIAEMAVKHLNDRHS